MRQASNRILPQSLENPRAHEPSSSGWRETVAAWFEEFWCLAFGSPGVQRVPKGLASLAPHPEAVIGSACREAGRGGGTASYARGSTFCYGICALYLPISGCAPVWRLLVVNSPNWKAQSDSAGNPPESASMTRLSFLWFNLNQPMIPDINCSAPFGAKAMQRSSWSSPRPRLINEQVNA